MVVLPLPVGPVTRMMPSGRAIISFSSVAAARRRSPSSSSGTMPFCRSRMRSTMFSPWMVGCAGDAEIDLAAGNGQRDATVLRRARFGDVHAAHHLDAHRHRRPVGLVQARGSGAARRRCGSGCAGSLLPARSGCPRRSRLTASVSSASIRRTTGWLYSSIGCRQALVVDLAGFDLVQDAVDRQLVAVVLVDGAVDLGFAGEQRFDLDMLGASSARTWSRRDDVVGCRRSPASGA